MHHRLSLIYDRKYEGAGAIEQPTEERAEEKRLVRNGTEREAGGLGPENAYPPGWRARSLRAGTVQRRSSSSHPPATIPPPPPRPPPSVSLRVTAARETGETYIFPLYTLPCAHPLQSLTALPNSRNKACRFGSLRALSTFTWIDENIRRIDGGGGQGGRAGAKRKRGLLNILCPRPANEYRVPPEPWYTYGRMFVYRYSALSVRRAHYGKWAVSLSHFPIYNFSRLRVNAHCLLGTGEVEPPASRAFLGGLTFYRFTVYFPSQFDKI